MASFPDLRPRVRLAKAKSGAALSLGPLVLVARVVHVFLTAFKADSELATLRGAKASSPAVHA